MSPSTWAYLHPSFEPQPTIATSPEPSNFDNCLRWVGADLGFCAQQLTPFFLPFSDRPFDPVGPRPRLDSMSSVEEDDYDTLTDIDSDKNVIRTKV